MKVKSKFAKQKEIEDLVTLDRLQKNCGYDECWELEKGQIYTVQGIVFWNNFPYYYIYPDSFLNFPTPFDSFMFEIVDERPSKYWKLSTYMLPSGECDPGFFFDKWAEDRILYQRLLNDDENAIEIFEKYKKILDEEFE